MLNINTMMIVNPYSFGGINLDTYFDTLNLQSNNASNFISSAGAISQWTDLSPNLKHATQATGSAKPTLTGGKPVFDGGDFLQISELDLPTFSMYIVYKQAANADKIIVGGSSRNDYFYLANSAGLERDIRIQANGGIAYSVLGNETNYNTLSIRRSNSNLTIIDNDRTLLSRSNSLSTDGFKLAFIGKGQPGLNFNGEILAVCVSSTIFDDATDALVRNSFIARYSTTPFAQQNLICFGDSITQGQPGNFPSQIATSFGLPYTNLGIAGSRFCAFDANSGITRYPTQLVTRPYNDKIVFLYGANDINSGGTSAAVFAATLDSMLQDLISKGYNPRNICIGSTPYQQGGTNSATLLQYRTAIQAVTTARNVRFADIYQAIVDNGGDSLMSNQLHPTNAGGVIIGNTFIAAMQGA